MRKYTTEFSLNVYPSFKTVIPASQLELCEKGSHKYHIYGILLAPKYFLKEGSIVQYEDHFSVTLFSNSFDKYTEHKLDVMFASDLNHQRIQFKSSYPHSILKVDIEDDGWCKKHSFDKNIEIQITELFDLYANRLLDRIKYKVLYIGQAYGKRGERSAIERLSSHETLQKILIDAQRNYPEYEIKIMLLEMAYRLGFGIARPSVQTRKSNEEDTDHIYSVTSNLPQEQQVINISEAALINYFKPAYNVTFVENFPSPKHKSYHQYYELDYNELLIEMDMEFDNFPYIELYTDTASIKTVWDFVHYKLENDENRESMYAMFRPQ